ncbi:MAG: hypothetical protein ABGX20_20815 [Bacillus sp. (in: firmicutes)]
MLVSALFFVAEPLFGGIIRKVGGNPAKVGGITPKVGGNPAKTGGINQQTGGIPYTT